MIEIIVCLIAGLGAGVGTGFAGMSAAAVISPMLIILLDIPAFEAIGIALASDVLASAVSAITYAKNKNIDVKNGLIMMGCIILFTVVGSWVSSFVPDKAMGSASLVFMFILGVKFLVKPILTDQTKTTEKSFKYKVIGSIISGVLIGFVCGFIGAGGGMMILFVLTSVLGYDLKMAVGTSVFIMTFTALTGSLSHFAIGGITDWTHLVTCVISTLVFAVVSARIANKAKPETLNKVVGVVLLVIGVTMMIFEIAKAIV